MSADDSSGRKEQQSQADRTLLGVAPPKLESTPESGLLRSPVFVRSGTAAAVEGDEPPPLPRMALPSRPPAALGTPSEAALEAARGESGLKQLLRSQPVLWMVALPSVASLLVIGLAAVTAPTPKPAPTAEKQPTSVTTPAEEPARSAPDLVLSAAELAALEERPPESLSAREQVRLAELRAGRQRDQARALREQLAGNAELAKDKAIQAQLLKLAGEDETAEDALLALSAIDGTLGPDLLYEAWTGTSARTDATELSQKLVYSSDVRPRASKALAVALDLRAADSCEKNRDILPRALTDGDKRSLHLLVKLLNKRGCGPKKADDCFACLRENKDELTATINAVKARRGPVYPAP